ncbi:uncharacterized protein LOC111673945 [Orussus abietinus]|uniref:uncharacterized protein LOC111673945 n=1 Tax=Orussus abietinus TaxID=222816 RepID=UPI000C716140|nr:uncharacterized protein LOC111673945 [Orussus abietinus]
MVVLILTAVALVDGAVIPKGDCVVSINSDLGDPQPLVLDGSSARPAFLYPVDGRGTLRIPSGEPLHLECPGKNNYLVNVGSNRTADVKAICLGDKTFEVNADRLEFSSLRCSKKTKGEARVTGSKCLGKYTQVEVGFDLPKGFLRTMEICRDDETYVTYYARFSMTKSILGSQKGYPRTSWSHGDFYDDHDLDNQYRRASQIDTLSKILNSTELGNFYVSKTTNYYFSRGHLTAKTDFVYGAAQWTTFWYLNSAPQWQTFNGGNWMMLEQDVRAFASDRQLDLEVYTGVHGQSTLPDVNGRPQLLYFYASNGKRAFPVPKFFWKIIHDPISERATAFVGVNDPYVTSLTEDYFICEDIGRKFRWLSWDPMDVAMGISYVCTVDDLRAAVPTVPRLPVTDILV